MFFWRVELLCHTIINGGSSQTCCRALYILIPLAPLIKASCSFESFMIGQPVPDNQDV